MARLKVLQIDKESRDEMLQAHHGPSAAAGGSPVATGPSRVRATMMQQQQHTTAAGGQGRVAVQVRPYERPEREKEEGEGSTLGLLAGRIQSVVKNLFTSLVAPTPPLAVVKAQPERAAVEGDLKQTRRETYGRLAKYFHARRMEASAGGKAPGLTETDLQDVLELVNRASPPRPLSMESVMSHRGRSVAALGMKRSLLAPAGKQPFMTPSRRLFMGASEAPLTVATRPGLLFRQSPSTVVTPIPSFPDIPMLQRFREQQQNQQKLQVEEMMTDHQQDLEEALQQAAEATASTSSAPASLIKKAERVEEVVAVSPVKNILQRPITGIPDMSHHLQQEKELVGKRPKLASELLPRAIGGIFYLDSDEEEELASQRERKKRTEPSKTAEAARQTLAGWSQAAKPVERESPSKKPLFDFGSGSTSSTVAVSKPEEQAKEEHPALISFGTPAKKASKPLVSFELPSATTKLDRDAEPKRKRSIPKAEVPSAAEAAPTKFSFSVPAPSASTTELPKLAEANEEPKMLFSFGLTKPVEGEPKAATTFGLLKAEEPKGETTTPPPSKPFTFGVTANVEPSSKEESKPLIFGLQPPSAESKTFAFGETQDTSASFSETESKALEAKPFTFGLQTEAEAKPAETKPFSFGTQSTTEAKPEGQSFTFGSQQPTVDPKRFTFGSQQVTEAKPVTFGTQPSASTQAETQSAIFGSQPAAKPFSFGSQTAETESKSVTLGTQPVEPKPFTFGNQPPVAEPKSFTLGSQQPSTESQSAIGSKPFTFGTAASPEMPQASRPTFAFGATGSSEFVGDAAASKPFVFGGAAPKPTVTPSSTPVFTFGATQQSQPTQSQQPFTFNQPSTTTAGTTSEFSMEGINYEGVTNRIFQGTPFKQDDSMMMDNEMSGTSPAAPFTFAGTGSQAATTATFTFGSQPASQPTPGFAFAPASAAGASQAPPASPFSFGQTPSGQQPFVFSGSQPPQAASQPTPSFASGQSGGQTSFTFGSQPASQPSGPFGGAPPSPFPPAPSPAPSNAGFSLGTGGGEPRKISHPVSRRRR